MATGASGSGGTGPAVLMVAGPNALRRVAGIPVLRRNVLAALRGGWNPAVVATDPGSERRVREELRRDPRTRGVPVGAAVARDRAFALTVTDGELLAPDLAGGAAPRILATVRDAADVREAERRLVARIRSSTAATDGPLARHDRALSTALSVPLARWGVHPNVITSAGTLTGLAGALLIARGTYAAGLAGVLLFWAAVILDGCDGEVARLTWRESRFGRFYDVATDNLVHVAVFAGIAIGAGRSGAVVSWLPLLVLLLAGFACAAAAAWAVLLRPGNLATASPVAGGMRAHVLRGCEAVMNRDFAYLLLALGLAGRLHWFLWGAAIGTWVYAALLLGAGHLAGRRGQEFPAGIHVS